MPRTAIVNPSRRRRRATYGDVAENPRRRRHRRNPDVGAAENPRRRRYRRRRNSDLGASRRRSRRRVYGSRPLASNPRFNLQRALQWGVPAGLGDLAARWFIKLAGKMDNGKPGLIHAVAGVLGTEFAVPFLGKFLGKPSYGVLAQIGSYGFLTSLYARKYWLEDMDFAKDNLYLGESSDSEELTAEELEYLQGLQETSALAAAAPQYYMTPQGQVVAQLNGGLGAARLPSGSRVILHDAGFDGLQETSALAFGADRPNANSSFGY